MKRKCNKQLKEGRIGMHDIGELITITYAYRIQTRENIRDIIRFPIHEGTIPKIKIICQTQKFYLQLILNTNIGTE